MVTSRSVSALERVSILFVKLCSISVRFDYSSKAKKLRKIVYSQSSMSN